MKKITKKQLGFTLVELIVVITILAILGTIAFISLQGYSKNARDSVRVSDMENIIKSMSLYKVKIGTFPIPSAGIPVTFLGGEVWTQGTIGESVITNLTKLNKKPVDPLTNSEYTFSRLNTKKEFQIAAVLEGNLAMISHESFVSSAQAAGDKIGIAYIKGNYNGVLAKVSTGGTLYTLAVPTIISGDSTLIDILDLQNADKLVYNGAYNLPSSYEGSSFKINGGGFIFRPSDIVVYTGSMDTLSEMDNRIKLIKKTQESYLGTDVPLVNPVIKLLLDKVIHEEYPNGKAQDLSSHIIYNSVNSSMNMALPYQSKIWCGGNDNNTGRNEYGGYFNAPSSPNARAFAALKDDGSISVWGSDGYGGLPALAPSDNGYIKIFSTQHAFAALRGDETISVWGDINYGGNSASAPTDSGYKTIYATNAAFAALKGDGSISVWGSVVYGGGGDAPSDNGYVKIYSTGTAFAALKDDGSITVWGEDLNGGDPSEVPTGTGFISISSTGEAFAALKDDGSVSVWGADVNGGDVSEAPTGTGFVSISSTLTAFAALNEDGSVYAWGANSYGGTGAPVDNGYEKIYASRDTFAAQKYDGSVVVWGGSCSGALSGHIFTKIFAGSFAFAGLKEDGTIVACGYSSNGGLGAPIDSGYIDIASTYYGFAALKNDGTLTAWGGASTTGWPIDGGYTNIFSTSQAFAAMKSDGSISVWGDNAYGGDATEAPSDKGYVSINGVCNN